MLKISLAAARVNAGLTQKQVANALNISNKTICSWENGDSFPDALQISKICDLYGIPYDNINFFAQQSALSGKK